MHSPLGRVHSANVSPTGSGRLATSRMPRAIAATRSGFSKKRSRMAPVRPELFRSAWFASLMIATIASAIANRRSFFWAVVSCARCDAASRARKSLSRVEIDVLRLVAMGRLSAFRREVGSNPALESQRNGLGVASVGDGHARPGFAGQLGRAQLGTHATRAQLALAIAEGCQLRGELAHRAQQSRLLAVGSVEAVYVGEQEQPVGLDCSCEQGAQFVVVTEGAYQFAHRDTVVLIYHRNHAELQQFVQCILQIA